MDIIRVFGTNVRKYRTQMKVSQEKFAELCGLHRTYISDIECSVVVFLWTIFKKLLMHCTLKRINYFWRTSYGRFRGYF